jgi:hypothetical protein
MMLSSSSISSSSNFSESCLLRIPQLLLAYVLQSPQSRLHDSSLTSLQAFLSAFLSYYLIKIVPFWGLTLLSTCVIYLAPLVYVKNKEAIDGQLEHVSEVITAQTHQIKDVAGERTSKGFESVKQYTGDYAAKAQDLMGSARQKIPAVGGQSKPAVKESQFPAAPKSDPIQEKPELASADAPIPAS